MGDTLEACLRQILSVSEGSLLSFVSRPMLAVMLAVIGLILVWPWLRRRFTSSKR
jgi:TctA family transporter